jgi:5-methylcytosine-specific restriction endonuclease McrA
MIVRVPNRIGLEHHFENQKLFSDAQRDMAIGSPHLAFFVVGRKSFSAADRMVIYDRERGHCFHCGQPISFDAFHVDHLVPVAAGGSDEMDNLAASCAPCNLAKSDSIVVDGRGE